MSVWQDLIGQEDAVKVLKQAALAGRDMIAGKGTRSSEELTRLLPHAWLIAGPPGSGRSNAAVALAAALQCEGEAVGCGKCHACQTVLKGTHLDVKRVATENVHILIQETRDLVSWAHQSPMGGRWRIVLIEDADRMAERTSNVLLKAIEEPPPRTLWLLCAPAAEDLIPTIRSRCRLLQLRIPPVGAVAQYLVEKDHVDLDLALKCARAAQSHIGVARRLATDPQARQYRRQVIMGPAQAATLTQAVMAAEALVKHAKENADRQSSLRDQAEKEELSRALGYSEEQKKAPGYVTAQIRALEANQKRRNTRAQLDSLDSALINLMSLYRDVYLKQSGAQVQPINADLADLIDDLAETSSAQKTLQNIDAIEQARSRLQMNGAPLLVMEALAISLRRNA